ncbi:hypothetical protein ACFWNN_02200 [Lentzea sp. NPDC058450]|uniref:hypothetical protein n=1 Tax=Lentzea sp. NPDC058450 TaxID=3346505 RepID=UPI003669039A
MPRRRRGPHGCCVDPPAIVRQSVEPGTAVGLATVTAIHEAGLDCIVFVVPILPLLTDSPA